MIAVEDFLFLFETSPTPMWIYDRDTLAFLDVNIAATSAYGHERDAFLAMTIVDLQPATMLRPEAEAPETGDGETPQPTIVRHQRKDGRLIDATVQSHDLNFNGRPARLIAAYDNSGQSRDESQRNRFFEVSPGLLCVVDLRGRFVSVNPAWERLLGRSSAELLARPTLDFVHPDDQAETAAMFQRLGSGELVRDFVNRYVCHDGSYRWLEWVSIGVPDDEVAYALARDITAEREAQAVLTASLDREQRTAQGAEMLARAALAMNLSLDIESMLQLVTSTARAVIRAHEASTSFVPDTRWERAITARAVSDARASWQTGDMWSEGSTMPQRVCSLNTAIRMTQAELEQDPDWRGYGTDTAVGARMRGWLAAPLIGRDGRNLGLVQLSDRDQGEFTAEDEAILVQLARMASVAIENAHLNRQILEREQRYRELVEALEAIVWEADPETMRYLYVSEQAQGVLGYPPERWLSEPDMWLDRVHVDDRANVRQTLQTALTDAGPAIYEYRTERADGREAHIRTTVWVSQEQGGRPRRLRGMSIDVTVEHRRQEMLIATEKLRALGQLAGGIAHDLNQSLTLIAGYGELLHNNLLQSTVNQGSAQKMAGIMTRAAYDAGESVSRLLTFSRAQPIVPQELLDLNALLHDVAQLTAPRWRDATQAEGRPIIMRIDGEGLLNVEGVVSSLREVLTNLIFNAVDAMPRGGEIRLTAREEGETVVVDVADTGGGMPFHVRSRIFEPYFTTKGASGTGLGLAMAFAVMQQHHGLIEVHSEVNQGSRFRLTFPRPARQRAADPSSPGPFASGMSRRLRILIVDDEPQLVNLLRLLLEQMGHDVTSAASGEQACEHLLAGAPGYDLLISDLGLGDGMNGWELAARAAKADARMPVMLVTGWGQGIDLEDAHRRGIVAVLAKPYHVSDLKRALVTACSPRH